MRFALIFIMKIKCPLCKGTGKTKLKDLPFCPNCNGKGYLETKE